jgi:excinuclease ABC subunit C
MAKTQTKLQSSISKIPDSPGVYFFLGIKRKVLYIGKASSLRSRVRSYFTRDIAEKRSLLIAKMVGEMKGVRFIKTDSSLEALILESALIKKYTPPYNTADKDQRSFNFIVITKEDFPRVLLVRERELAFKESIKKAPPPHHLPEREGGGMGFQTFRTFGPFPHGSELREALKIVRKIFPFRDKCIPHPLPPPLSRRGGKKYTMPKPCFNFQIGLCPGVCAGKIDKKEYRKTIRHIVTFFEGKKKKLVRDLEKEMRNLAKQKEFEKAEVIKRKIFAVNHINDIALLKNPRPQAFGSKIFRIEAYDIAHTSGTNMVGVMTVVENGEAKKGDYRMFKISSASGPDDTKALKEVLRRRLGHPEWRMPDLMVVDGGAAQLNAAMQVLNETGTKIPVVAVTKDERHRAKGIRSMNQESRIMVGKYKGEIILANSEAHRFAIKFHRKLRDRI